jgi:ecdysteroid kinase
MMGEVTRLHLGYEGAGGINSVIMKSPSPSETNRNVANAFRLYEREVLFYREVASRLGPLVPGCYFAQYEKETGNYVILLEDLHDYRPGDQVLGCDAEEARLGLDVLARLHSMWWHGQRRYPWIPGVADELISAAMIGGCAANWETAVDIFGGVMPADLQAAIPTFINALPRMFAEMAAGPQTLAHTDFRLDNLLFATAPEHRPLVVVDWSSVLVSKGAHDVAFLLSQNLRTEERRAHEQELVRYYHDRLVTAGVTDYNLDECWRDYRFAALFELVYAILIGGSLDVSSPRATSFVSALISRCAATISDLDLLRLITT